LENATVENQGCSVQKNSQSSVSSNIGHRQNGEGVVDVAKKADGEPRDTRLEVELNSSQFISVYKYLLLIMGLYIQNIIRTPYNRIQQNVLKNNHLGEKNILIGVIVFTLYSISLILIIYSNKLQYFLHIYFYIFNFNIFNFNIFNFNVFKFNILNFNLIICNIKISGRVWGGGEQPLPQPPHENDDWHSEISSEFFASRLFSLIIVLILILFLETWGCA